jgi:hypothetical protein
MTMARPLPSRVTTHGVASLSPPPARLRGGRSSTRSRPSSSRKKRPSPSQRSGSTARSPNTCRPMASARDMCSWTNFAPRILLQKGVPVPDVADPPSPRQWMGHHTPGPPRSAPCRPIKKFDEDHEIAKVAFSTGTIAATALAPDMCHLQATLCNRQNPGFRASLVSHS